MMQLKIVNLIKLDILNDPEMNENLENEKEKMLQKKIKLEIEKHFY